MKALTLWQPWASLIAIGAKPYEFRSWAPPKQFAFKRIAIHAGARKIVQAEITELIYRLEAGQALGTALNADLALPLLQKVRQGFELPLGHILGTAILGWAGPSSALPRVPKGAPINPEGAYAWPLTKFQPLEPPEGLWDWTPAKVSA